MNAPALRHDWTLDEIRALLDAPFLELVDRARAAHKRFHDPSVVQLAQLANIKPGGCAEEMKRLIGLVAVVCTGRT